MTEQFWWAPGIYPGQTKPLLWEVFSNCWEDMQTNLSRKKLDVFLNRLKKEAPMTKCHPPLALTLLKVEVDRFNFA